VREEEEDRPLLKERKRKRKRKRGGCR
jgi:hypothetical protein